MFLQDPFSHSTKQLSKKYKPFKPFRQDLTLEEAMVLYIGGLNL